jgi:hypothetical protein
LICNISDIGPAPGPAFVPAPATPVYAPAPAPAPIPVPAPAPTPVFNPAPAPAHVFAPAAPEPVLVDINHVAVAGEQCVEKIVTVEETESDEQLDCKHRQVKRR